MPEVTIPGAFVAALQSLTQWFTAEKLPHTIIGGVAVSIIAAPRATQDIDALVWLPQNRWEAFLEAASRYGFAPRIGDPLDFARRARVFLFTHETGVRLDLSCGALEFERAMIDRSVLIKVGELELRLPTPEDLIITKAVAHRPKDSADIDAILGHHPKLDFGGVRTIVKEFADALEMPAIYEDLDRLLRQHEASGGE